ncbi:MAG: EF-P lysine aminoacylase EpmA [Pirellulaceae bacterium]
MMNPAGQPDLRFIHQRADLLRRLRAFFDSRGFIEVQTPCLSRDCVVDPYIDPLSISREVMGREGMRLGGGDLPDRFFLQTSPEAAMKRMLAAGAPSIYSMGPVFRADEFGDHHNIEFTMLEWYDLGADMDAGVMLLGTLVSEMMGVDGYDTITYRDVFRQKLDIDPIDASEDELRRLVAAIDVELASADQTDRDDCLNILLSETIQPALGTDRPMVVTNYPASQAALAKPSTKDPKCAARFELFSKGIELANGYDELLDADVLVERAKRSNQNRIASGRNELPVETQLVQAMRQGLPQCAGVALGVDRLLMVCTDASSISQVMPFTISKA